RFCSPVWPFSGWLHSPDGWSSSGCATTNMPGETPADRTGSVVAADTGITYLPPTLGDHELVLLHGQPGSAADWQQVAGRLPARFHAVAADRPGYGLSQLPARGFA